MLKATLCTLAVAALALTIGANQGIASSHSPAADSPAAQATVVSLEACDSLDKKETEECKGARSEACQQLLFLMKRTDGAVEQAFAILCGKGGRDSGGPPPEVCADLKTLIPADVWAQLCGKKKKAIKLG
ncbi:MAG TPA: hypothetical protein VMM17_09150 [Gemmatimonadaceae bacterium]|nr:hypothetical protein [Gemmatimonadaceae bacterium]